MKILEVRDGFIRFEADVNVYLSSFIQASGIDKVYIAQVNQMKVFGNVRIASAKILFILVGEELYNYDKTLPSKDSEIELFTSNILSNSVDADKPVILGKTLDCSSNIIMDASAFNKKMLVSIDNIEMNNTFAKNFHKQFANLSKKTVVLDMRGVIKGNKCFAGKDFKLPLNSNTLDFMYKACLNDATESSKNTVAEIFEELKEYSATVPFVPFDTLKSIIDDMVNNQHIFKLLVLKNKLAKFKTFGYFASSIEEVNTLTNILESEDEIIIDLSKVDKLFQNYYLDYIYSSLTDKNVQVLLYVSNSLMKKNLKLVLEDSNVPTTLFVASNYQYLNDIKNMFDNFIIEPSSYNNKIFNVYGSFLSSMMPNTYLIAGENINYIPMISKSEIIDEVLTINVDAQAGNSNVTDNANVMNSEDENDDLEELELTQCVTNDDTEAAPNESESEKNLMSQEEIIANINEKSDNFIDSISKDMTEPSGLNLFSEDEDIPDEQNNSDENDSSAENNVNSEIVNESEEQQIVSEESLISETDIIEPEYSEVNNEPTSIQEQEVSESSQDNFDEELVEIIDNDSSNTEELDSELSNDILPTDEIENQIEESVSDDNDEPVELTEDLLEEPNDSTNNDLINDAANVDEQINSDIELNDSNEQISEDSINSSSDVEEELTIPIDEEDTLLLEEAENLLDENASNNTEELGDIDNISSDDSQIIPLDSDNELENIDEFVELDPNDLNEDDYVVNISDEHDNINIDEDTDKQIMQDVDKVYTTIKESDEEEIITDSDLDLIDELNGDDDTGILENYQEQIPELEVLNDDGILESDTIDLLQEQSESDTDTNEILEKRDSNTPIVPVYDADIPQEDVVTSDPIQQGDSVIHAKYGNGIVEKMIKYGTKTLFSINFENVGRRLLDPTLTEIKKL